MDADPGWTARSAVLVAALMARVAPVSVAVADTAEVDEVQRLRFRAVVDEGWARAEDFPDGRECDHHDASAIHVVARDTSRAGVLVGTMRVVLPRPGHPLPLEEAFDLVVTPVGQVVDVGRAVVLPRYRGRGHDLYVAMLARAWEEVTARGFVHVCGTMAASLVEGFRTMGFDVELLGPPRRMWGRERFPVRVDGRASLPDVEHALGR